MKRFFKFALVALATAAVAVACQKPEQKPETIALKGISLNKEAVELAIGAKETLTVNYDPANATEKPAVEWSSSDPAVATVANGEVTAVAAGEATITAKAGSFTATCKVTVKDDEEQPQPGDFVSPDWANVGEITEGNHTFKFTKDAKNAYFFSERTSEGRFNDIWGGEGYIYFAFDFDNDLNTGETLNSNGKYEYIGFIYCFGEKPKVEIVAEGDCLPATYTVKNVIAKGTADDNSVKVEYCVPLADLPPLPENFTIYTWGNKDMAKVIYKFPYEAPAPVVTANIVTVTPDLLPTQYQKDDGGEYTETRIASGDVQFNIFTVANYGNGIQIRKEGGYVSNHTSFGKIEQIKVTVFEGKDWYPTNLVLYAGTEENPSVTVIEAASDDKSSTFDLSGGAYTHFTLKNTSSYAVYLDNIEVSYTGDAVTPSDPTPAAGIKIDGDFSDWAGIEGTTTGSNRISLWKASSDADNIYLYYEITASKVKTSGANFDWSPYIYIGLDTDNNSGTGAACGGGTTIAGCEVQVCTFPWRGTNTAGDGTEEVFDLAKHSFVNGEDTNGWIKYPVSGSSVAYPVIYGKLDGSICYLELSIPRSAIGSPTGTIALESAMDWYPTGSGTVTLQ